jgi:hypothetical protein
MYQNAHEDVDEVEYDQDGFSLDDSMSKAGSDKEGALLSPANKFNNPLQEPDTDEEDEDENRLD